MSLPFHVGRLLGCGLVAMLLAAPLAAEEPSAPKSSAHEATPRKSSDATREQIDTWIAELSDDSFAVRQTAAGKLLAAGRMAREALVAVSDGPDPETRAAARRLVALIDQNEFEQRLAAFAADTEGRHGLTLPGWEAYRSAVGGDPAARALFVEMQREEGPLLATVFGDLPHAPEHIWEERLLRLVQWPGAGGERGAAPPLGSCAALLFLGTAAEMNVSDRGAMLVENMIQRPPIREELATAGARDAIRRLVSGWILNCPNENEHILARRLSLASTIGLKEALPLALAVAGNDPKYASVPPATRAVGILLVGQLGDRSHVRHLEHLLDDATVCMPLQAQVPGQPAANVQVRDVALVVMLHLTGQRPADYGYLHARLQPQRTFQLQTLHCENDARRAAAAAKWRAWRATRRAADD